MNAEPQDTTPPAATPIGHGTWLEYVEIYDRDGLVNQELLRHLSGQMLWHDIYAQKPWYNLTKRLFDFVVAAAMLLLLSLLFVLIAVAIVTTSGGPVFYTQVRIGRACVPFRIYKFKTMINGASRRYLANKNMMVGGLFKIEDDDRITPIGRKLRRWSLDELPQLINILLGDMSLVGPRPLPPEDTTTVSEDACIRFAAPPGLTGLWQATVREIADGQLKIRLDAEYVRNRGWLMDAVLLAKTVPTVILGRGAW